MSKFIDSIATAAAAVAAVYFAVTGNYTAAQYFATIAFTANSISAANREKRRARDAALAALTDRTITVRGSDEPQPIVYGESRLGGVLVYACNHGARRERLTMVLALAGHECDAINAIYVGDTTLSLENFDADGWAKPDTKWYDSRIEARTQTVTGPAAGGAVLLDRDAVVVDSVAYRVYDAVNVAGVQVVLKEGTDWVKLDSRRIQILAPSVAGVNLVIDYRWQAGQSLLRVKRFLGVAAGERDTDLEAASGGEWTSAHLGKEVCRLHVTFVWNERVYGAIGLPPVSARVRGKKVYNWVTGTTEWSRNAARCVADYLTSSQGFAVPAGSISVADMQAAQLSCDESVPLDSSGSLFQARYTVDGALSTDADRRQNLQQMLTAMVGTAIWSGGKWIVRAGVYQAPVFTLGDDDLADGDITLTPGAPRRDLFNSVKGRFVDVASATFQSTSFPPYVSSTYVAQDGGLQIDADIDLPLVGDPYRAQRIAKLMLQRHRVGLNFRATYKFSAYAVSPGDTVYLKHGLYGWDTMNSGLGKLFRVLKREFGTDGKVVLSFQEEAAAIYAWDFNEATAPDPAPNLALPDPTYVPPLSGFAVSSSAVTYSRLSDGTVVPYATVSWSPVTDSSIANGGTIRVWWKRADETEWRSAKSPPDISAVRLTPVSAGETINVRGYAESALGIRSAESFAVHIVSLDLASANIAGTQSGNLLTNPSFASGVTGWEFVRPAMGLTDPVTFGLPTESQRIASNPTCALFYQGGTQNTASFVQSSAFPVIAGQRYVAFCSLMAVRCVGLLMIRFYDAAGNLLHQDIALPTADMEGADSRIPAQYRLAQVAAYAPASAVFARVLASKSGTVPGKANSGLYIHKPYAGVLNTAAVTYDLPEWAGGAVQTTGTGQLEPGAATGVVEVKSATSGVYTDKTTGITYIWLGKVDVPNPHAESMQCVVSALEEVQINFTGTGTYKLGLALTDDPTSLALEVMYFDTVASGGRGGGTMTVQRTFTARPQTVETYYLIVSVAAGSGALGAPTDVIYGFPRLRAELIKR